MEIITNPEDAKEPWYYKRVWSQRVLNLSTGTTGVQTQTAYYPDWRYTPVIKPLAIGSAPVRWFSPVYHVQGGAFAHGGFSVSEVYAALDWARAYKEFLEDVATLMRAYSRFAFKLTTKGGKQGVQAAKARLGSTLGATGSAGYDRNPPPTAGSTFVGSEGTELSPLNVRGASVAPEDGRRFLLMVAAALGLPETFFGDASVGNHATAKTLDRPTELAMQNRQTLWADVHTSLIAYILKWAVKAPLGPLHAAGTIAKQRDGNEVMEMVVWKPFTTADGTQSTLADGAETTPQISVTFPPILALDVTERITAIVSAATLDGKALAGTLDVRTTVRLLLSALGETNVDAVLDALAQEQADAEAAQPSTPPQTDPTTDPHTDPATIDPELE